MANKFKVWVDTPGSVIQDAATFATDTQRSEGFQAGQAASALRVNSALRQANLVAASLMELVDNSNLDLKSSVTDVSQGIDTWLTNKITNTTVTNASNVSSKINNKNITDIFESNGTTVKNATNSLNATNATNATNSTNSVLAVNAINAVVNDPNVALTLATFSRLFFNTNHRLTLKDTSEEYENEETIITRRKLIYNDTIIPRPQVPSGSGTTDIVFEDLVEGGLYEFQMIAGTRVFYQKMLMGNGAAEAFTFGPNIWNIYYTPSTHTMKINQVSGTTLHFVRIWRIFE